MAAVTRLSTASLPGRRYGSFDRSPSVSRQVIANASRRLSILANASARISIIKSQS